MFGSIGWAVTMFVMGMVLDHSKLFQNAKCPMSRGQRNYDVCFFAFAAYMSLALIVATQIPFRYLGRKPGEAVQMNNIPEEHQKKPDEKKDKLKQAKVFAQTLRGMPNFIAVFKAMANLRMLMIMLVAWVMGIGMGLIFTFLFWHLQVRIIHLTSFSDATTVLVHDIEKDDDALFIMAKHATYTKTYTCIIHKHNRYPIATKWYNISLW